MVIDEEAFQGIMAAVAKASPSVAPMATFTPGPILEEVQAATKVGNRSLW